MSERRLEHSLDARSGDNQAIRRLPCLERFPYLLHAITVRRAPDLVGECDFDLSCDSGQGDEVAARNRSHVCALLGIELSDTVWFQPAEPGEVQWVSDDLQRDAAGGVIHSKPVAGLVTGTLNLFLCALFNDNAVAILFDPHWYALALVSIEPSRPSGENVKRAVAMMAEKVGSQPEDMLGVIGPSLGPCCHTFSDSSLTGVRTDTNLWDLVRTAMLNGGLRHDNVFNTRICTGCRDLDFFSRAVDGPGAGAGALVLGAKDDGTLADKLAKRRAYYGEPSQGVRGLETDDPSLTEEQIRLNEMIQCPYGRKKVYIRSVLTGSMRTTTPELALRCAAMAHVGLVREGFNIVNKKYIESVCCEDHTQCEAYQRLQRRQKQRRG